MSSLHGTTIIGVRKDNRVTIAGDGQVSLGNTVIKGTAKKIRIIASEGNKVYQVLLAQLQTLLL